MGLVKEVKDKLELTLIGSTLLNLVSRREREEEWLRRVRENGLRIKKKLLDMDSKSYGNHLGSCLSCVDILATLLYKWFKIDGSGMSKNTLILSKGHAAPAFYAALSELGLISEEELRRIGEIGSRLQTHFQATIPGVKVSTGSLGQGLSIANGLALAAKMDGREERIYVIMGDGELDEGQVWEAAMTASTYGLNNIIVIIDRNLKQLCDETEKIKVKEPLKSKWESFGWKVIEIDGHEPEEIIKAVKEAEESVEKPTVIIARTSRNGGLKIGDKSR